MALSISGDDSAGRDTVLEDGQSVSQPFTPAHPWIAQVRPAVLWRAAAELYGGRRDFDGAVVADGGDI